MHLCGCGKNHQPHQGPTDLHVKKQALTFMSFEAAQDAIKLVPKGVEKWNVFGDKDKLEFYALFKQATLGDNTTASPGFWNPVASYKWQAWTNAKGLSTDDAERKYTELARTQLQVLDKLSQHEKESLNDGQASAFFQQLPLLLKSLKSDSGGESDPSQAAPSIEKAIDSQLEDLKSISSEDFSAELNEIRSRLDAVEKRLEKVEEQNASQLQIFTVAGLVTLATLVGLNLPRKR